MKSKKVLTILLSLAIMLTFMPTMAFATEGDGSGDALHCTVTLSDGKVVERDTIEDAVGAVDDGGSILVKGTVKETPEIAWPSGENGKAFTIDYSGATLDEGVTIEPTLSEYPYEGPCWIGKDGKYAYYPDHDFTSASAEACANNAQHADITVFCSHDHSVLLSDVARDEGAAGIVEETDTTITYKATLANYGVSATWTVAKVETTEYRLDPSAERLGVDYSKAADGYAVMDGGKVSFFATYQVRKNGGSWVNAVDDNNKPLKLTGEIVGEPTITRATGLGEEEPYVDYDVAPTERLYGSHTYKVAITFPDGTKYVDAEEHAYFTFVGVMDTAKLKPEKGAITGIQFQYKDKDGEENWIAPTSANVVRETVVDDSVEPVTWKLVMGDDGSLTYRLVYLDKNNDDPEADPLYGDAKTLTATKASLDEKKECGAANYSYNTVSETYTIVDVDGADAVRTYTFTPSNTISVIGSHDYDKRTYWASKFVVHQSSGGEDRVATHSEYGKADAVCKFCGRTYDSSDSSENWSYMWVGTGETHKHYMIPKTDDHTFVTDEETGADKVVTVAPTCQDYGFQYKICTKDDGNWNDGEYVLKLDDEVDGKTYTFTSRTSFGEGHPVLVAGSVKDKVAHKYYVTNVQWEGSLEGKALDADVYCVVRKQCMYETNNPVSNTYHKWTVAEAKEAEVIPEDAEPVKGTTDTYILDGVIHVFGKITPSFNDGADCSELDEITYTVNGIMDVDGNAISKKVKSTVIAGSHTYKNTVEFSANGKTATVLMQCTNTKCKKLTDKEGNVNSQKVDATVSSVDNADGSTTYTATVLGLELTNNTKTVFDLTRAQVVINGGEEIDLNELYHKASSAEEFYKLFKELVVVTINGATIDSKLYELESDHELRAGLNEIFVVPADDSTAVEKAKGIAKCIQPNLLYPKTITIKDNGKVVDNVDRHYNKNTVEVAASDVVVMRPGSEVPTTIKVDDATIKYAVTTDVDADADDLTYDLDKVELTNASPTGEYYVYAQLSKDGYTTVQTWIATIGIEFAEATVTIDHFTMTEGDTPDIAMNITGEDANLLDKADITIVSAGGQALKDLKPGTYLILALADNFDITTSYVEDGTVGTVTVLAKDGSDAEEAAKKAYEEAVKGADAAKAEASKALSSGNYNTDGVAAIKKAQADLDAALATKDAAAINSAADALKAVLINPVYFKAANDMKVKTKKVATKVGKKKTKKAVIVSGAEGKVTIKKANKAGGKKIVVKKNGKVVVKKGLKKGTYKVKVKVTAKGDADHKAKTVKKTVTVVVKK